MPAAGAAASRSSSRVRSTMAISSRSLQDARCGVRPAGPSGRARVELPVRLLEGGDQVVDLRALRQLLVWRQDLEVVQLAVVLHAHVVLPGDAVLRHAGLLELRDHALAEHLPAAVDEDRY